MKGVSRVMRKGFLSILVVCAVFVPAVVLAGNIDATNKTAKWLEGFGKVNFGTTEGDVTVTDTEMTGYAWGDEVGWINFQPTNGGIVNDGDGNLSGYAWGELAGWINFNPTNGGVTLVAVDSDTSAFTGYAWSENYGWLSLNCSDESACGSDDYKVWVDWVAEEEEEEEEDPGGGGGPDREVCEDGDDNDGDGVADEDDPGCHTDGDPNNLASYVPTRTSENSPPELTLQGSLTVRVALLTSYLEPGYVALDYEDGNITNNVVVSGSVNANQVGTYVLNYSIADSNGATDSAVRFIEVYGPEDPEDPDDPDGPGGDPVCGDNADNDGDGTPDELDPACHTDGDPTNPDSYDPNINSENEPPRITLAGLETVEINAEDIFTEPGFEAFDSEDGDLTEDVVVTGTVTETSPGVYEIVYTVTDSEGLSDIATRRVVVVPVTFLPPIDDILETARNIPTGFAVEGLATVGLGFGLLTLILAGPARILAFLLSFVGYRRRGRPWGTVYDSVTKQPLDPAYVTLMSESGEDVDNVITDLDGRYGFLVGEGSYRLKANKTNYTFPSEKLRGRLSDQLYNNLYFGGMVELDEDGGVITRNIPLDPVGFDWNEFAKRDKRLMRFYSKWDIWFARLSDILFYGGFAFSIIAVILSPGIYNYAILVVYLGLTAMQLLGARPRIHGKIFDASTGNPMSYAIVRIKTADNGNEVRKSVCDEYGRYLALVANGTYTVTIEEKLGEDSYHEVFTSGPIEVKKGVLRRTFRIQ